jgi:hypothetical protein
MWGFEMSDHYDIDGNPITMDEWTELFRDKSKKILRKTSVGSLEVSTVWLGLDHGFGASPPLIFETMIFGGGLNNPCWRWTNKHDAVTGHHAVVDALKLMILDSNWVLVPEKPL